MRCVHCNHAETKVIETRESSSELRRRRECLDCNQRFTTYEKAEHRPIRVMKKGKASEIFNPEKMMKGISLACEKRPVSQDQIEQSILEIEQELRKTGQYEITTKALGDMVMEKLKKLDKVAYLRFASVYKQFKSLRGFEKEIQVLTGGN